MSNFWIMISGLVLCAVFVVAAAVATGHISAPLWRCEDGCWHWAWTEQWHGPASSLGRPGQPGKNAGDRDGLIGPCGPGSPASPPDADTHAYDLQPDPVTGELAAVRVDDLEELEPGEEWADTLHAISERVAVEDDWQTADGWQHAYPPLVQPEDENGADPEVVLVALADFHAGLAADWAVTCRWVAVNERRLAA